MYIVLAYLLSLGLNDKFLLSVYGTWVTLNKRDLGTFWVSPCIHSTCIVLFGYYVM